MAPVRTGQIYRCYTHAQEGHELAGNHPVVVISNQELIDEKRIAIVAPLTSTVPDYPVHWAIRIEKADSYAAIRHIKSISTGKLRRLMGEASPREMNSIREGLAREFGYENHDYAQAEGQAVAPGSIWLARIPNIQGTTYETDLLILTSNYDTGMVTGLAIDSEHRGHPRQSIPVRLEEPDEAGFAITYQVRSISVESRLTNVRGQVQDPRHLTLARAALLAEIGH